MRGAARTRHPGDILKIHDAIGHDFIISCQVNSRFTIDGQGSHGRGERAFRGANGGVPRVGLFRFAKSSRLVAVISRGSFFPEHVALSAMVFPAVARRLDQGLRCEERCFHFAMAEPRNGGCGLRFALPALIQREFRLLRSFTLRVTTGAAAAQPGTHEKRCSARPCLPRNTMTCLRGARCFSFVYRARLRGHVTPSKNRRSAAPQPGTPRNTRTCPAEGARCFSFVSVPACAGMSTPLKTHRRKREGLNESDSGRFHDRSWASGPSGADHKKRWSTLRNLACRPSATAVFRLVDTAVRRWSGGTPRALRVQWGLEFDVKKAALGDFFEGFEELFQEFTVEFLDGGGEAVLFGGEKVDETGTTGVFSGWFGGASGVGIGLSGSSAELLTEGLRFEANFRL